MRGNPMKKFFLLFIVLFVIQSISATPVFKTTNKNPQPQETIIATIKSSGELIEPLTQEDITFYEGKKQVFPEFAFYEYNQEYFLSITFSKEGIYRLESNEIVYRIGNEVQSKTINETFTVAYTAKNNQTGEITNLLSVKPGAIYTLAQTAKINLYNRGSNDLAITIGENSLTLEGYQAQTINLNLVEPLSYVTINTYKTFQVPVIYLGEIKNNTNQSNQSTPVILSQILFRPSHLTINLSKGETRRRYIELANNGESQITNITNQNNITGIALSAPSVIEPKSAQNLTISITANQTPINDELIISYVEQNQTFNLSIPITLNIKQPIITPNTTQLTCLEHGGTLCDGKCDGESNFTSDGFCCYGTCSPLDETDLNQNSSEGTGWIFGLLIFLVLGIIGFFVYKKYKKVQTSTKPDENIEKTKKRYENRMQGALSRH